MEISKYHHLTPQDFIRRLYQDTADGRMTVTYYPNNGERSYDLTHPVCWDKQEAEELIRTYNDHIETIIRLVEKEKNNQPFTQEETIFFETYLKPMEPFEVEEAIIRQLHFRGEYDQLEEEEYDLLERHYQWYLAQSLRRLPFKGTAPFDLIELSMYYAAHLRVNSPQETLLEISRHLAKELVLYTFGRENPQPMEV